MRRLLIPPSAAAAIAAGFLLITALSAPGAGAAPGGTRDHAGSTMQMPGGGTMQMPSSPAADARAAAAADRAPAAVEMHKKVVDVTISNFAFKPKRVIVSPGTRVVWTNKDSEPHTVTSDHPAFASQALNTGSHFTLVAHKTGTFTYHCQIHPFMHGALVVKG